MSDETPNPPKLTPEEIKGIEDFNVGGPDYMVRQAVEIPETAIKNWINIPLEQNVTIDLKRADYDRLYFCMAQMSATSFMLAQTIRLLSFQDLEGANAAHKKAHELVVSADSNFRHFFAAVMAGAKING